VTESKIVEDDLTGGDCEALEQMFCRLTSLSEVVGC